jgi:hypothetical protein
MRINFLFIILTVLSALSSTGCSATWYKIMEKGRISACEPLHGQERYECLQQATMPYEEYTQKREKALAGDR